jgi:hypothetical protein
MMFYHPDWERVDSARPLTVTVEWVKAGAVAPRVTVLNNALVQVVQQTLAVPAGADGTSVTATLTVTAAHLPGVVEIYASGGNLRVRRIRITHHVRGWMYNCPAGGLTCVPRVSRVSVGKPLASRWGTENSAAFQGADYWGGDVWPPQVYWAVTGMHAYGLPEGRAVASEYARRMLLETRAWGASRGVWERTTQSGVMTGSDHYCWGALTWLAGREIGFIPNT